MQSPAVRPFYKMLLGGAITLKDMECVDPEYYRSLVYILEHPGVQDLELTFSVDHEVLIFFFFFKRERERKKKR